MEGWTLIEAIAVVGNLAYTVLMMLNRRLGWLFGIAASALGCALFWHMQVYAQVGLNAFYVLMGAYGWWQWGQGRGGELPITRRGPLFHLLILLAGAMATLLLVHAARYWQDAQHVELDATVTAFSLLATWMLARRILENWAWWIVTDSGAIVLYLLLGLHFYAALYAVYVGLSIAALVRWKREWRASQALQPAEERSP
ncbi:MAG: nicotinamide riboside transporter PnuC [Flavobacteriales bacterium]|nr:nicotinamide riboside transporter PnuC [Flavobacteriales bacterium]